MNTVTASRKATRCFRWFAVAFFESQTNSIAIGAGEYHLAALRYGARCSAAAITGSGTPAFFHWTRSFAEKADANVCFET